MDTRRVLERLGFGSGCRVVVVHADDVGMCEATVSAYRDLMSGAAISAASTMVPCPWFPAVAQWCREHPAQADMGVHLTLNSEWESYRWSPLLGAAVPSLRDASGFLLKWPEHIHRTAERSDVDMELQAQVEYARAHGIDVTHVDSHIYTLKHPSFIDSYLDISHRYRVPNGVTRGTDTELESLRAQGLDVDRYYARVAEAEADGLLSFDAWEALPLDGDDGGEKARLDGAQRVLDRLPEGLSCLVFHPAMDTPELRAIAGDWPGRVADYKLLRSTSWRRALETSGVRVIGMRPVRDALFPASRPPS
jgi:chitin disaccharide deacetylase